MLVKDSVARFRPAWGSEGRGAAWLAVGIGATFALGLALQLIGLRVLDAGDYATFVLGLSVGNVASAIAAAIQPVVAVRSSEAGGGAFLPAALGPTLLVTLAAAIVGTTLLIPGIGAMLALLVVSQVPIHAALGIGTGRLQARRAFGAIAVSLVLLSVVRIGVVAPSSLDGGSTARIFVVALPIALLGAIAVIALRGGFRALPLRPARDGRILLGQYLLWALAAWLINGDAVFGRLLLSAERAGDYALAFTLGRQPIYAVAPLTMVLLPVTLAGHPAEQRGRFRAILAISALLAAGTIAVLTPAPEALVELLTGESTTGDPALIRGYALVGSLAAAATLLLTFAFALGHPPKLRWLALLTAGGGIAALVLADSSGELLTIQGVIVLALTVICYRAARAGVG
jgi:O-antigen/teichoic acid export membrane protein